MRVSSRDRLFADRRDSRGPPPRARASLVAVFLARSLQPGALNRRARARSASPARSPRSRLYTPETVLFANMLDTGGEGAMRRAGFGGGGGGTNAAAERANFLTNGGHTLPS